MYSGLPLINLAVLVVNTRYLENKQGPQGSQRLISLKSLKIPTPPPNFTKNTVMCLETIRNGFQASSRRQNLKERPNRFTNNNNIVCN